MARNRLRPDLFRKWARRFATWHVGHELRAAVASGALAALIIPLFATILKTWPQSRLALALGTAALASGFYTIFTVVATCRVLRRCLLSVLLALWVIRR